MAALPSDAILLYPRHKRFVKGGGWELHGLCLSPDGNIIVSGFHYNGKTYMDVYSTARDNPTIIYSRECQKYSDKPYQTVSCHDYYSSVIICCVSDKLEVLKLNKSTSKIVKSLTVDGQIRSVVVIDGETFLSMSGSNTVNVFDRNFDQTKSIKLEGIEGNEYPWDMAIVKDRIFVITRVRGIGNRALSYGKERGNILTEFHNTIRQSTSAQSIAVSVNTGLVVVLWNGDQIIAYPFSEDKPLLVFYLSHNIRRIRISEGGYLVCGSIAGEIQLYHLEHLFSFDGMKRTLAHLLSSEECERLRRYFRVTKEETVMKEGGCGNEQNKGDSRENVKRLEHVLTCFERGGHFDPWNTTNLRKALETLDDSVRVSILKGPIEGYAQHGKCHVSTIENLEEEMKAKEKAWEIEKQQLNEKINTLQRENEETLNKLHLEQDNQLGAGSNFSQMMLKQAEHNDLVESSAPSLSTTSTTTELEAEFGRLIVKIADHLTLDNTLKLSTLFNLPESINDFLHRMETPGIKLLRLLRQRSIINMYDVTNLQRALKILQLEAINNDLLIPYQLHVDDEQYEIHKLDKLLT